VKLPDFPERASRLQNMTNAYYVSINPVLANNKREEWEKFSFENTDWVKEKGATVSCS